MRVTARVSSLWKTMFRRTTLDRELDDEIRATVQTLADRYLAAGMSPHAAERAALAALGGPGGILQVKEDVRDGRIGAGLESLLLDLRYAWRSLWSARRVAIVIVITLALGIGANAAIFSVVRAMLLQPLPYRDAGRLVFVWLDQTSLGYPRGPLSGPDLQNLRQGSTTCADFGAIWATGTVALSGAGDPEQLRSALVTANFFQVLGVESAIGRTFRAEDSAPGAHPTVLLGWDLFARRFGGDRSIVGRDIVVNDQRTTVIGVMPPTFRLLLPPDSSVPDHLQVWQPFGNDLAQGPRGNLFLRVIGRMRPGVTLAQTRADLDSVAGRITREFGISRAFTTVILHADAVREIRGPLLALFVGVAILLMIACVNVASLLIARAATRTREIALRLALGASRTRLLRQSLVEGLLLTLIGAAAGTLVGYVGLQALVWLAPESLSRIHASRMDVTVLGFTLAISVAWGVLFSLAPTIAFVPPARLRRFGGPGKGPSLRPSARRSSLVVVQVALSVVLLIGAGLLARAFVEVQQVDPGFRTDRHLTFRVALPDSRYHTADAIVSAAGELRRRLATLRGVTGVGAISHLPYDDLPNWYLTYALEPVPRGADTFKADARAISTGLFEALGVQLVEGRFFTDDESPMNLVVIVDELLARQMWPGRSAVGQHFLMGQASPERRVTVVGVVRHLRLRSLVDDLAPQIFVPYRLWQRTPMAYVVRTYEYPPALAADIRAAVAAFDPQLPIYDLRPLKTYVQGARSIRRFTVLLAVAFAAAALALASIGVYGVLAYSVAVRRRELGVRRALGANTAQVMREVLREGLGVAVAGSAGGIAGAAIAAGLLQNQLYAVNPRDPITYVVAVALVLGSAALACWIPARRASAISVMDAMRIE